MNTSFENNKWIITMLLSFILVVALFPNKVDASTKKLKSYDPLTVIQIQDDCEIIKKSDKETLLELSNGNKSVFKKEVAEHGGINYTVTEGELTATLEITPDHDIYINGERVEYNSGIETNDLAESAKSTGDVIITPRAGGWISWTNTPIVGSASSYTRIIKKVTMGNIVLKSAIMTLPLSVVLAAITAPLGIGVAVGTTFAANVKTIYDAANLNPKKLWYNEHIIKHSTTDKATQYKTSWRKSDGSAVKSGKFTYGYCTIG